MAGDFSSGLIEKKQSSSTPDFAAGLVARSAAPQPHPEADAALDAATAPQPTQAAPPGALHLSLGAPATPEMQQAAADERRTDYEATKAQAIAQNPANAGPFALAEQGIDNRNPGSQAPKPAMPVVNEFTGNEMTPYQAPTSGQGVVHGAWNPADEAPPQAQPGGEMSPFQMVREGVGPIVEAPADVARLYSGVAGGLIDKAHAQQREQIEEMRGAHPNLAQAADTVDLMAADAQKRFVLAKGPLEGATDVLKQGLDAGNQAQQEAMQPYAAQHPQAAQIFQAQQKINQVIQGLGLAGTQFAEGMTSPESLALISTIEVNPEPLLGRVASLYFAGDMSRASYDGIVNGIDAWRKGDTRTAVQNFTAAGGDAWVAFTAGKHGVKGEAEPRAKEQPKGYDAMEKETAQGVKPQADETLATPEQDSTKETAQGVEPQAVEQAPSPEKDTTQPPPVEIQDGLVAKETAPASKETATASAATAATPANNSEIERQPQDALGMGHPDARRVEEAAIDKVSNKWDAVKENYRKVKGALYNKLPGGLHDSDEYKRVLAENASEDGKTQYSEQDKNRHFSSPTHNASSVASERGFDEALARPQEGKDAAELSTGMAGSGKSSVLADQVGDNVNTAAGGNFASPEKLDRYIKKIDDSGHEAQISHVHIDPITSFKRVIERGGRSGRFTSLDGFLKMVDIDDTILDAAKRHSDVDFRVFDNNGKRPKELGGDGTRLQRQRAALAELETLNKQTKSRYNVDGNGKLSQSKDLRKALQATADELYGKVNGFTADDYEKVTGQKAANVHNAPRPQGAVERVDARGVANGTGSRSEAPQGNNRQADRQRLQGPGRVTVTREEAAPPDKGGVSLAAGEHTVDKTLVGKAPSEIQFKQGTNAETGAGGSKKISGNEKFDATKAGAIDVWRDPKGQLVAVDGHHRLDLAQADADTKQIKVNVIDAKSAADAKVYGALKNIAKGNVKPEDVQSFLASDAAKAAGVTKENVEQKARDKFPNDTPEVTGKATYADAKKPAKGQPTREYYEKVAAQKYADRDQETGIHMSVMDDMIAKDNYKPEIKPENSETTPYRKASWEENLNKTPSPVKGRLAFNLNNPTTEFERALFDIPGSEYRRFKNDKSGKTYLPRGVLLLPDGMSMREAVDTIDKAAVEHGYGGGEPEGWGKGQGYSEDKTEYEARSKQLEERAAKYRENAASEKSPELPEKKPGLKAKRQPKLAPEVENDANARFHVVPDPHGGNNGKNYSILDTKLNETRDPGQGLASARKHAADLEKVVPGQEAKHAANDAEQERQYRDIQEKAKAAGVTPRDYMKDTLGWGLGKIGTGIQGARDRLAKQNKASHQQLYKSMEVADKSGYDYRGYDFTSEGGASANYEKNGRRFKVPVEADTPEKFEKLKQDIGKAKGSDVVKDETDEQPDGEPAGFPKSTDDITGFEPGALRATFPGAKLIHDEVMNFGKRDVAPALNGIGGGFADGVRKLYKWLSPRSEGVIGKIFHANAPRDAIDALMEMKGEREENIYKMERGMKEIRDGFNEMTQADQIAFVDRVKTGKQQPTPELQAVADLYRKMDDDTYKEIQKFRPNQAYLENHFRVMWKDPAKAGKIFSSIGRRPLQGSKGFMKQHILDDMSEGIARGLEPVTYNPQKLFELAQADALHYISAQKMWKQVTDLGYNEFKKPGTQLKNPDFVKLDDNIAQVYFPAAAGDGMIKAGEWYVDANTARLLENYLSKDRIRSSALGKGLMWVKNATTAAELSFSPFHAVFEGIDAGASRFGIGAMRFVNQGVVGGLDAAFKADWPRLADEMKQGARGIKEMVTSPAAFFTSAREGGSGIRYFTNPAEFIKTTRGQSFIKQYPDAARLMHDLFSGGGKLAMHEDYKINTLKTFREEWNADNHIGAALRAVPAINELAMRPMFDLYIPRLKVGQFLREYSQQILENHDRLASGDLTRNQLARQVWDRVENRFGEMNFDNLFWDKTIKSAMQLAFRSVTWKLGSLRGIAGAATGQARELATPLTYVKDRFQGKPGGRISPRLHSDMAWVMGVATMTALLSTVLQKSLTGKMPSQLIDFVHPQVGGTDDRGKPNRVTLPTYLKDMEHLRRNTLGFISSSTSEALSRGIEGWNNEDFYGNYVFDPKEPALEKLVDGFIHVIKVKPFALQNYQQLTKEGGTRSEAAKVLGMFGFNRASREADLTDAERELVTKQKERGRRPLSPEQVDKAQERKDLLREGREGDPDFRKDLRVKLKEGDLSGRQARDIARRERLTWQQDLFKRATLEEALDAWDKASPEERQEWRPLLAAKAHILKDKTPNERAALLPRLRAALRNQAMAGIKP